MENNTPPVSSEKKLYEHRWLVIIAVMLAAIIEVLDMTIVNVSLPQMMGSLGADTDQITWVLTSYIVSSAIVMVLTGFLVDKYGRRRLLITSMSGFLISSMLCGLSMNLIQIVLFRTIQGIFGASLIPLSQYILRDTFPKHEQGMAMAIWGTGIMAAPVLGPTIGAYITEILNWRWVFYINFPVCMISLVIALRVITDSPHKNIKLDWYGLLVMALGVGSLQIFLDKGNSQGWFESKEIIFLLICAVGGITLFIIRGLTKKDSIVNLQVFKDWNFTVSTIMLAIFCICIFGIISIQPLMLERLLNYPIITTGLIMAPRGLASAVCMIIAGKLMAKYDVRIFISLGIAFSALGSWLMCRFSLDVSQSYILLTMILQGIGMGFFFVPISALSSYTLPEELIPVATGLFSFGRSLGSSIGISILSTIITRETQLNWHTLGQHLQPDNYNFIQWMNKTGFHLNDPHTLSLLGQIVGQQSQMNAFLDAFFFTTLSFSIILPFALTLKKAVFKSGMAVH
ncbi:MAG: DHA2 family efflux MFS transporter permease subunit [Legionellales bacterium]|nr:DHA2 family efflux MFS transporter permease subunit [Legionellales bacterium]